MFFCRARGLFLSVYVNDIKLAGKTENVEPTSKILVEGVERECQISNDVVANYRDVFESRISVGAKETTDRASGKPDAETIISWSYDMEGHAKKCVERYCELAKKQRSSYTKSQRHARMTINLEKKLDQLENCPQFAHKLF